jgi:hypothetical protein
LFFSCHEAKVNEFHFEPFYALSPQALLSPEAPPETVAAFRHLDEARAQLYPIFHNNENRLIRQQIRDERAQKIEKNLREAFAETNSIIPLEVLAKYLAAAHLALVQWWLEERQPHTPEMIAQTLHRLQRAAIRDTFGLEGGE